MKIVLQKRPVENDGQNHTPKKGGKITMQMLKLFSMQATAEQPLLFQLPEAKLPRRTRTVWDELGEMARVIHQFGVLVPASHAAKLLNLSRVRVYQLIENGTFRTWEFHGQKCVCAHDMKAFVEMERKTGRPGKDLSTREKMEKAWAA
jgi:hypothetical protein